MVSERDIELGGLPNAGAVLATSVEHGRALLRARDSFVENQSRFDRQARLNLRATVAHVDERTYLEYVGAQVVAWQPTEIDRLRAIVEAMGGLLERFTFDLPSPIHLVKTTGQEEGYAAYTRRRDVIVLPANMVASLEAPASFGDPLHPGGSTTYLQNVILHECFHLFSKNNPVRRRELYELIGYHTTAEEIVLPDVGWPAPDSPDSMADLKITNPDTPTLDAYITMRLPTEVTGGDPADKHLLPVLLASGPYDGGLFFEYLQVNFMSIVDTGAGGEPTWTPELDDDGRPIMFPMDSHNPELTRVYERRIGHNLSGELFHPDEVLAQNWVLVANEPSLGLLTKMSTALRA